MRSELEKMLAGELYQGFDPELVRLRQHARRVIEEFNATSLREASPRMDLLTPLFSRCGEKLYVEPPFRCDYGGHIEFGDRVYLNFDCLLLDCARITIGDDVMFGPGVHLYTAHHPLDATERIRGPEYASPITIGSRCWIGGRVIMLPGVTIGENTTIGAGSVVTRDLPAGVVAAGNPCRVLRRLDEPG